MLTLTLIAILCFVALAATAIAGFAAYTNSRNAQRTIAAYDADAERFSSTGLKNVEMSKENVVSVFTSDVSIGPSRVITVCNYPNGMRNKPNEQAVIYDVLVRLVKYDESAPERYVPVNAAFMEDYDGYSVTVRREETSVNLSSINLSDNSTFSNKSLTAGVANSDKFVMTFSTDFVENRPNALFVEMVVTPRNEGLHALRGIFKPELQAQGAVNAWEGYFSDDKNNAPSAYDGYNYCVTGVGEGSVTITWDSAKVALSYQSRSLLINNAAAVVNGNEITFAVDSDDEYFKGRYDLIFHRVNITTESWSDMESDVVECEFVE